MSTSTSSPDCDSCSLLSEGTAPVGDVGGIELLGSSDAIRRLHLQVRRIGPHFRTVLIRAEDGSGGEQVARRLHGLSQGAAKQFVRCHAEGLEDALRDPSPESFGDSSRGDSLEWLARMARGGTLFLDGVEEMPVETQTKLLRILRRQKHAGNEGETPLRLDLRVIAATNEDLRVLACAGRFGQELYQRLATVEIAVPPLRERMEDLPELVRGLLDELAARHGGDVCGVARGVMERMKSHRWPGNMRELENVLHSALLQSEGGLIKLQHLPAFPAQDASAEANRNAGKSVRLQDVVDRHVIRVLRDCGGNKLRAAERLGISRSTLYRMLDAGAAAQVLR